MKSSSDEHRSLQSMAKSGSDRKGDHGGPFAPRPKNSGVVTAASDLSSSGSGKETEVGNMKDFTSGPVQLLKKNSVPPASRNVLGAQSDAGVSDADGRRLWERDDRVVTGMGEPDVVGARKEAPSFRVISQAVGPHPDQVLRSVEATGVDGGSVGHGAQSAAAANAQFVGQIAHAQHGIDVHQLPADTQFLHQHISPEACLQQPIFLVKLPQQQQMAQGGSQPQVANLVPFFFSSVC
jgi:hypothetical protein